MSYFSRLKLRDLLQRFRLTRVLGMDAEGSEEPKAKRPCVTDEKQSDTEENEGATVAKEGGPRFAKRRKCVLLMAYNGKGYMGMQKNPGVLTIEEDLLEALSKAGAFPEEMKDNLGKLQFQRCARTDKGVSAARQVVSIKMVPEEVLVPRVNSFLPNQIHVMALKRVTKSFDSRHNCSARTYEYLLPTYAFAPFRLTNLDYRIDNATVTKVTTLLSQYVGTHNFHNFTSGTKFEQMASNRFIMSFECGRPFLAHSTCSTCKENREVEFLTLKVKGQSFMIHQIRKMIGLIIAIVRGRTGEETLARAYEREKVDIPRAPGLGLLLENVHFERYNVRIGGDGIHELLDWTPYDEKVEEFKRENIHQSIIDTEINEMSMSQWLGSLQIHDFNQTATRLKQQKQQSTPSAVGDAVVGDERHVDMESELNTTTPSTDALVDLKQVTKMISDDSSPQADKETVQPKEKVKTEVLNNTPPEKDASEGHVPDLELPTSDGSDKKQHLNTLT